MGTRSADRFELNAVDSCLGRVLKNGAKTLQQKNLQIPVVVAVTGEIDLQAVIRRSDLGAELKVHELLWTYKSVLPRTKQRYVVVSAAEPVGHAGENQPPAGESILQHCVAG